MTAAALLERLRCAGVTVHRTGRRLVLEPAARVPADVRPVLDDPAVRHDLARLVSAPDVPPTDDPSVVALAEWIARRYAVAQEVRRRCGSGLPGAAARDRAYRQRTPHAARLERLTPDVLRRRMTEGTP